MAYGINDLTSDVAAKLDLSKKDTHNVINAITATITEKLAAGEKIQLIGFGSFQVSDRAARTGRNPQTGEKIELPATKVARFHAGKGLKEAVAK